MFCEIPDEQFLVISWYLFCSTYLFYAILYIVIYFRWINDIGSIIVLYIFPHFYKLELAALKTYSIHQPRKIVITNNIIIQANNNSGINSINIRACRFQLEIPFTDTIRLIVLPLSRHVLNYIIMLCGKTVFVQFFVEGSQWYLPTTTSWVQLNEHHKLYLHWIIAIFKEMIKRRAELFFYSF